MLGKLLAGRTASTLFTLTIVPGSALLLFLYQGMDPEVASLQEGIDQTMMMLLATRYLIAQCRKDTDDVARALAELEELLPLRTDVRGAWHPDVLATRYLIAQCRKDAGDVARALAELEEILPLYTDVQGARHPYVLATRSLRAECLLDLGDREGAASEIEGVRDGLVAAGLKAEHRFFKLVSDLETRLSGSP